MSGTSGRDASAPQCFVVLRYCLQVEARLSRARLSIAEVSSAPASGSDAPRHSAACPTTQTPLQRADDGEQVTVPGGLRCVGGTTGMVVVACLSVKRLAASSHRLTCSTRDGGRPCIALGRKMGFSPQSTSQNFVIMKPGFSETRVAEIMESLVGVAVRCAFQSRSEHTFKHVAEAREQGFTTCPVCEP